jgi:D-glycero-D-manno-heptose 1,7-bisphosphate phosphatase
LGNHKALFLDRDGVINIDKGYVHKIVDFIFTDHIFKIISHFQKKGYLIVVVTNQSGIARGFYSEQDFLDLTDWMINEFSLKGIRIEKVYFCPHHPDFDIVCNCRKPSPGMILKATKDLNIDLENSILIGDNQSDLDAGQSAGVKQNFFLSKFIDKHFNEFGIF